MIIFWIHGLSKIHYQSQFHLFLLILCVWVPEHWKQHKWFAFCLCRGSSCRLLLLNALSLGESLNSQKWLLLLPGTFLGDITVVFLGGYAESEAMSVRWAEQGLAWPPAAYRGLRSRESCPRTQWALLWASMPHSCFCGVSAPPFFFLLSTGELWADTHLC